MTAHREVQPQRCEKCNGTGKRRSEFGTWMVPCNHARRTDVTGLDDDTETILALQARVTELESKLSACMVSCDAERAKARMEAIEECARVVDDYAAGWSDNEADGYLEPAAELIRALKAGA